MRDSKSIMRYVHENDTHFLEERDPGRWKHGPYYYGNYVYGRDLFGCGAEQCEKELYLEEEVIRAFTCKYSDYGSDFEKVMVCLTNRSRIIIGYENKEKSYEYDISDYDLNRMKLNGNELTISNKTFRLNDSSECRKIIDWLKDMVKKYS